MTARPDGLKEDWVIAKVEDTFLGYEDHGILTAWLLLDYGGASQGTPAYDLRDPAALLRFVKGFMDACGVESWTKIKGRTIYAERSTGIVSALKPLPTEPGKQFNLKE